MWLTSLQALYRGTWADMRSMHSLNMNTSDSRPINYEDGLFPFMPIRTVNTINN
jgi:hypothetical protein